MADKSVIIEKKDYSQSANKVFHFMGEMRFLKTALKNKALSPRYSQEDVSYLNLHYDGKKIEWIYILQKCFCDIPKSSLFNANHITINEELLDSTIDLTEAEKENILAKPNTHNDIYGSYGIAFSKKWAEDNKLQPVHYINEQALDTHLIQDVFSNVLDNTYEDSFYDYFINELVLKKPIRGTMFREYRFRGKPTYSIPLIKNFYNEQEWRYIPDEEALQSLNVKSVDFNSSVPKSDFDDDSDKFQDNSDYKDIWLNFTFTEIEEIIVPNKEAVEELITFINSLDDYLFSDEKVTRELLISKITTLEDIGDDYGKAYS